MLAAKSYEAAGDNIVRAVAFVLQDRQRAVSATAEAVIELLSPKDPSHSHLAQNPFPALVEQWKSTVVDPVDDVIKRLDQLCGNENDMELTLC